MILSQKKILFVVLIGIVIIGVAVFFVIRKPAKPVVAPTKQKQAADSAKKVQAPSLSAPERVQRSQPRPVGR